MKKFTMANFPKIYGGGVILLLISSLFLFGCNQSKPTLKSIINSAAEGSVIDLDETNCAIENGESYTISKSITIKNGKVKNATFTVDSNGVVFENLAGIKTIMVTEKVGDGDFYLKSCNSVNEVYVNGGGSESVHLSNSTVVKLSVNKENVRVKLEEGAEITSAYILKDCKLDSDDDKSVFTNVVVAETVNELCLAGKTNIEKIVSTVSGDKTSTTIKIEDKDSVNIKAADEAIKGSITSNNTGYTAPQETVDSSEKDALTNDFDKVVEDSNKTPETSSEVKPDPNTSLAEQEEPSADLKIVKLEEQETTEGILIKFKNIPENADSYTVFIDGIGRVYWSFVYPSYVYNPETEKYEPKLSDTFLYPYVQNGKEYTIRAVFSAEEEKDENGFTKGSEAVAWQDIKVTAKGGKGEPHLTTYPEISIEKTADLKITTAPKFSNASILSDWGIGFEFYEGQSWDKENSTGWKWKVNSYIENSDFTKYYNLYLDYTDTKLNFVSYYPSCKYKAKDGTIWSYRFPAKVKEFSCSTYDELWTKVTDFSNVAGTWKQSFFDTEGDFFWVFEEVLTITANKVTFKSTITATKQDGSDFSNEEKTKYEKDGFEISDDGMSAIKSGTEEDLTSEGLTLELFATGKALKRSFGGDDGDSEIYEKQ